MSEYKAEDLVKLIKQRYPNRPGHFQTHAVLEQVPNGTGMFLGRWIDVAVFNLWPSKGLTRMAFEVKVSRSDFIRELQTQAKHKWALECFHEFWFVAPQDAIQLEELPLNAGWMCPRGDKLAIKRHAVQNPNPRLDDVLLAAFMRAASQQIDRVGRTTIKEVLEGSSEYQKAKVYRDALTLFINQRGNLWHLDPTTPEEVVKWLDDATMDKQLKQDREHLLQITGYFQRDIMGLLRLFLILANKSLLARDKLGKYMVSSFGGVDDESLEALKEYAKNSKTPEEHKRYAELVELLINWDTGKHE